MAAVSAAIVVAFAMGCRREEPKPPSSPPMPQTAPQPPAAPPATVPGPGATTPAEPGRTVGQTLDDAGITAKVKASLLASPDVKGTDVNVTTEKGVVRLTGSLDAQSQIDRAVQIARGTEGVTQVESSLTVKSAK
jgi:hyperosmotically inducible protein